MARAMANGFSNGSLTPTMMVSSTQSTTVLHQSALSTRCFAQIRIRLIGTETGSGIFATTVHLLYARHAGGTSKSARTPINTTVTAITRVTSATCVRSRVMATRILEPTETRVRLQTPTPTALATHATTA